MQNLTKKSSWGRTALAGSFFFSWVHRLFGPMKADVSDAWRKPTINCTKPVDTMDGKANRRNTRATNCAKRASGAGVTNTKWWDEDNRRWHTDRDWDDHDHDRDH